VRVIPTPSVRAWLRQTRIPGLRTAVRFGRTLAQLRRLHHLAETVERLEAHSRALVAQLSDR